MRGHDNAHSTNAEDLLDAVLTSEDLAFLDVRDANVSHRGPQLAL